MSVHITKYTKPSGCGQCFASDRALGVQRSDEGSSSNAQESVPHTSIELTDELAEHFKSINAMQAPVFVLRDADTAEIVDFWTGFRPDKINQWKSDATEVSADDERFMELPDECPSFEGQAVVA